MRNIVDKSLILASPLEKIVKEKKLDHVAIYEIKTRPRTAIKLTGFNRAKNDFETVIVDQGNLIMPTFFNRQKYGL